MREGGKVSRAQFYKGPSFQTKRLGFSSLAKREPLKVSEEGHSVIIAEFQPQLLPASSLPPRLYYFNHVIKKERAWDLGAHHVKGCSFGGTLVKGYPKPGDQRMTTGKADAHSLQP